MVRIKKDATDLKDFLDNSFGHCINTKTQEEKDIPLMKLDKYTSFSPNDMSVIYETMNKRCNFEKNIRKRITRTKYRMLKQSEEGKVCLGNPDGSASCE
jgi:hypothetical protein